MSNKTFISKGGIFLFSYIIICAISNVLVNHTTRTVEPIISLFYTSIFTILFFSALNFGALAQNIALIKANRTSILWLNLWNAMLWFVIFYSLKFLSPAVFSCLFLGAIPIHLFLLDFKKSKTNHSTKLKTILLLSCLFILMVALVYQEIDGANASEILKYGALVTIIGGIIAAFIMKISKNLAVNKLPASLVVSLRFYGLFLISFILILSHPSQLAVQPTVLFELLALALVSMALPLFLLQKTLETLNPLFTSIIITVIPILTYFLQLVTRYYSFSSVNLGIILMFSIVLILLTYVKKKDKTE